MAISSRPARAAKLSAAVEKAFGEVFVFQAMTTGDDVNARNVPDTARATEPMTVPGIWRGPAKSVTPKGRGSASDDHAHNWTTSFPTVGVEDSKMLWIIRIGDTCLRQLTGEKFAVGAPFADGHGRTTIPLTSRVR